jgi:hypothetical protein
MNAALSDPPTPRARARTRAAQRREQERAAQKKERGIRRREQRDEEFRLREQQGLSPPATPEYSSSEEEEEESDGGRPPERWVPAPPSPRAVEAVEDQVLGAGSGAPAAGRSTEEVARASEVPTRSTEVPARRGVVRRRDGGGVGRGLSACRALEEEEAGLLHPEVGHCSSRHSVSRGVSLIFSISRSQGGADRPPPLAPAKVLRSDAAVPTSRQLKPHEQNYPTHDLEFAVVVLPLRFGDIT